MELDLWVIALLCFIYFATGFINSVAGSGGLIAVPAFLLTGIPPELVLGTNKLVSCCGMSTSLLNYARSGLVAWRAAAVGGLAVFLGAALGARSILLFDSAIMGKIIAVMLPVAMAATFIPRKEKAEQVPLTPFRLYVLLPAVCGLLGFYEGFFGPGAGSFFILALHFVLGFGLLHASATTKLLNLIGSISGVAVFMWHGKVLYLLALPLAISSSLGNHVGSSMAIKVGAGFVRKLLMVSLVILFVSLVWKFWINK